MTRLRKVADYLEEVRENMEQKELHELKVDKEQLILEHPDASDERDKSLYTF